MEGGHGNAATHLLRLAIDDPQAYAELKRTRAVSWGLLPKQPLERCCEHLCHFLIVQLQGGLGRKPNQDMTLSEKQCLRGFIRLHGGVTSLRPDVFSQQDLPPSPSK